MSEDDIRRLARRIAAEQGIGVEEATADGRRICGYDIDIIAAAMKWVETGVMPDTPDVEGKTPDYLHHYYYPTQTFALLQGLRKDLDQTIQTMKHLPTRRDFGPDRRPAPKVNLGEMYARLYLLADEARSLHDDAVSVGVSPPLIERIGGLSIALVTLRDELRDRLLSHDRIERDQ